MERIEKESSVGVILFNPAKKVLVVFKKWTKIWEFPQGKIEPGENLMEALKREVEEETGIRNFRIIENFHKRTFYRFRRKGSIIEKTVDYFLGTTREKVNLSEEHKQYKWCTANEAYGLFKHQNHKDVLKAAVQKMLLILLSCALPLFLLIQ